MRRRLLELVVYQRKGSWSRLARSILAEDSWGIPEYLVRASQDWLLKSHTKIDTVTAEVMPKNAASLRVFVTTGFRTAHRPVMVRMLIR